MGRINSTCLEASTSLTTIIFYSSHALVGGSSVSSTSLEITQTLIYALLGMSESELMQLKEH